MPRTQRRTPCALGTGIFTPSHDRAWLEHYARTPDAVVEEDIVTLKNVRDWNHDESGVLSRDWVDAVEVNPNDVEQVWFILSAIGDSPTVGHSMLSFELTDVNAYTFSIEARREEGESYSALKGVPNNFELWYGWGTERDFVGVTMFLLKRPTEFYPLNLTAEERAAVFRAVAEATHEVAEAPEFYDTFSANCTNLLAKAINDHSPGNIPYDPAWNLPGLAPAFLADLGYITVPEHADDLRAAHRMSSTSEALKATIQTVPVDFSQTLRSEIRGMAQK